MQNLAHLGIFRHIGGVGWGRKITNLKIYWVKVPWVKFGGFWTSRGWEIIFSDKTSGCSIDLTPKLIGENQSVCFMVWQGQRVFKDRVGNLCVLSAAPYAFACCLDRAAMNTPGLENQSASCFCCPTVLPRQRQNFMNIEHTTKGRKSSYFLFFSYEADWFSGLRLLLNSISL